MTEIGSEAAELTRLIIAWLSVTGREPASLGIDREEALSRAETFRQEIRQRMSPGGSRPSVDLGEILYALVFLLGKEEPSEVVCRDLECLFEFITGMNWADDELGGRAQLLQDLSFIGWRSASRCGRPPEVVRWLSRFTSAASTTASRSAAERVLSTPQADRQRGRWAFQIEDTEQLLLISELLRARIEVAPQEVLNEAEYYFAVLTESQNQVNLSDAPEYFLGEFALTAGIACRVLALRDRARKWLAKAESYFRIAPNSDALLARAEYLRLSLRLEERDLDGLAGLVKNCSSVFRALQLPQDALKCSFLQANVLRETARYDEAARAFEDIKAQAEELDDAMLAAIAAENLVQIFAILGARAEAIREAEYAAPILQRLKNRVQFAKVQVGLGYLLRSEKRLSEAIAAFREAQRQFAELGMHADVAANRLVVADIHIEAGEPRAAEQEILAALPVIEGMKLVPEGIAALSLLRESVRRRQIDRQALRSLNGYFEELKSFS